MTQTCLQCDNPFDRPYVMKRPFCGRECREGHREPCVCRACGATFPRTSRRTRVLCDACKPEGTYPSWLIEGNAKRAAEARRRRTHVCRQCGKVFVARQAPFKTFCTRECSFAFKHEHAQGRAIRPKVKVYRKCVRCGAEMLAVRGRTTCGAECRRLAALEPQLVHPKEQGCVVCGTAFRTMAGQHGAQVFCSERCRGKAECIDPQRVFDRDGWRCGICSRKVNRRAKFPHPKSAVLDHIIPLAKGGEHTYRNVQCAHNACNSCKQANDDGVQLRLIG